MKLIHTPEGELCLRHRPDIILNACVHVCPCRTLLLGTENRPWSKIDAQVILVKE